MSSMTLLDLGKLVRHYLKLVIALPVVCILIALVINFITPSSFQATASLTTNADLSVAGGYAQNETVRYSQNGITVSSISNPATQSIGITAEGNDYGGCIAAANAAILALSDDIRAMNSDYLVDVVEATAATDTSQSLTKMIILAAFIGVFLAICIVVLLDIKKSPIKSRSDIKEASGLSVVGEIPARDYGERLLANIRFSVGRTPSTIAVVPVSGAGCTIACAELANVLSHSGVAVSRVKANAHAQGLKTNQQAGTTLVVECPPLYEGMGAAYIAREADITLLCVTEWLDSRKVLKNVTNELNKAKANLGGVVFLVDGKPAEDF